MMNYDYDENIFYKSEQIWSRSNFFSDQTRKIDYVLVTNVIKTRDEMDILTHFIENLVKVGVEYEISTGLENANLIFIKLHAPEDILNHFATVHNIGFERSNLRRREKATSFFCPIFQTALTSSINRHHSLIIRAEQSVSGRRPMEVTSSERSLVMEKILQRTYFSDGIQNYRGFEKLINMHILSQAYPLHDGSMDFNFSEYELFNDRQLLREYWGSMFCLFKVQPLNLVFKYYGAEVAFYFAFLDFYTRMLIAPAIVGLICMVAVMVLKDVMDQERFTEICNSTRWVCPNCILDSPCDFYQLNKFCSSSHFAIYFDNVWNVMFAIFMILWSGSFTELWKRRENELKFRWNLMNVESDSAIRYAHYERTKYRKRSIISRQMEPYVPPMVKLWNYSVTFVCCLLMIAVVFGAILLTTMYRLWIISVLRKQSQGLRSHLTIIQLTTTALLTTVFIKFFTPWYLKFAIYLTTRENPRTLVEYHNSCIYKVYLLAFVNNYFPVFYQAFIKGRLFTYPGDLDNYRVFLGIRVELCHPSGCALALAINLLFILVLKTSFLTLFDFFKPYLKSIVTRWCRIQEKLLKLPRWEQDYKLADCAELFMMPEFSELAVQYGFVTFFATVLPIAPFIALISNIIEIRIDARKFLHHHKRPKTRRLPGIGAWNQVFRMATFCGTITNAFVIAFTTDIIGRESYRFTHGTLHGYYEKSLPSFHTSDYPIDTSGIFKRRLVDICAYISNGNRFSYDHPLKYEYSDSFYEQLCYKFGFVVIFEQLAWLLNSIFISSITELPRSVKQELNDEHINMKQLRHDYMRESQGDISVPSDRHFQIQ